MAQKSGLVRNIKYLLYCIKIGFPTLLLIPVMCFIFSKMYSDQSGLYMNTMLFLLIPMIMPISYYTVQYKYVIGFSSTRKNFYLFNLVSAFLYAVITVILGFITDLALGTSTLDSPLKIIYMFLFAVFMGILGTFYGILMYRSAKLGFIAYIISFMLVLMSSIIYTIFTIDKTGGAVNLNFNFLESFTSNPLVVVIIIAGSILFSFVNWFISRKLEIKA